MTEREKPPFPQPTFATRVRWRSPEWKMHTSQGHARRAMAAHRNVELWEFRDGDWYFVEERKVR